MLGTGKYYAYIEEMLVMRWVFNVRWNRWYHEYTNTGGVILRVYCSFKRFRMGRLYIGDTKLKIKRT